MNAAETPEEGSWADSRGLGRCPRCRLWLRGEIFRWIATRRGDDYLSFQLMLCGACTREVADAWNADWKGLW